MYKLFNVLAMQAYKPGKGVGKVFQFDMDCPSLHDYHNDYPSSPKHRVDKSTPKLSNKRYYILSEHNRIEALKHGLRLVSIHQALIFDQAPFLKQSIDFNTNLRIQYKNPHRKKVPQTDKHHSVWKDYQRHKKEVWPKCFKRQQR